MPLCIVMIPVLLRQKYRKRRRKKSVLKSKRKIHHLYYGHVIKTFKSCQQCIKTKTKTVWYLRSHFWRRYRNKSTIPLALFSFTFLGGDVLQKLLLFLLNIKITYIISLSYIHSYLYEILPILFFNVSCQNIDSFSFFIENRSDQRNNNNNKKSTAKT